MEALGINLAFLAFQFIMLAGIIFIGFKILYKISKFIAKYIMREPKGKSNQDD